MQGFTTYSSITLSFTTDTQNPQTIVPVFFIHTLEQPFCSQPFCVCHQNQVAVTTLLAAIDQGTLALRETADFLVPCQQTGTADHHPGGPTRARQHLQREGKEYQQQKQFLRGI